MELLLFPICCRSWRFFFDEFDIGDSQGKIQFDIEIKRLERGELIGEWIQYR